MFKLYVKLDQGAVIGNYYWLPNPRQGRGGHRIYVQCPDQEKQCSYCLESASHCTSGAVDSLCMSDHNTIQMDLRKYMRLLQSQMQSNGKFYKVSLHKQQFPLPANAFH